MIGSTGRNGGSFSMILKSSFLSSAFFSSTGQPFLSQIGAFLSQNGSFFAPTHAFLSFWIRSGPLELDRTATTEMTAPISMQVAAMPPTTFGHTGAGSGVKLRDLFTGRRSSITAPRLGSLAFGALLAGAGSSRTMPRIGSSADGFVFAGSGGGTGVVGAGASRTARQRGQRVFFPARQSSTDNLA